MRKISALIMVALLALTLALAVASCGGAKTEDAATTPPPAATPEPAPMDTAMAPADTAMTPH